MVKEHPDLLVRALRLMDWKIRHSSSWTSIRKAQALGVSVSDVNQTISGSTGWHLCERLYRSRTGEKSLCGQADALPYATGDINGLYVRSANGKWCLSLL